MRTYSTRKRILVSGGAGFLGWTPRVALDDGLPQAIAYFRDSSTGTA